MNDGDRQRDLLERVRNLDGIDVAPYERMLAELALANVPSGYDATGRLKIAMFDARSYDLRSFEAANDDRFQILPISESLSERTARAASGCKVVCIFVNDRCDAQIIETFASMGVELIALRCAGFNNVDLEECRRRSMSLVRVPAYSPSAVAEHTIALMLTLNRRLHQAYVRNRVGYFVLEGLTGFDMRGKTVGVVGTGKIGRCVIEILLGFGCQVLAFDPHVDPEIAAREGVRYVDLDELLSDSHIVTLHLPLFTQTHHLIDSAAIEKMREGVMLINTSRGGLVDARALIDGLKSGKVGAAGLDVYEEEAGIFFHDVSDQVLTDDVLARLLTFNNVVVTSHQGFLTHEALANIADTTLQSVEEFRQGKRGAELTFNALP